VLQKQRAKGSDSGHVAADHQTARGAGIKEVSQRQELARGAYNSAVFEFKKEIPAKTLKLWLRGIHWPQL
jgi:hypothetical protein